MKSPCLYNTIYYRNKGLYRTNYRTFIGPWHGEIKVIKNWLGTIKSSLNFWERENIFWLNFLNWIYCILIFGKIIWNQIGCFWLRWALKTKLWVEKFRLKKNTEKKSKKVIFALKNGRNCSSRLNLKKNVNYEVIFEINDENYSSKFVNIHAYSMP